MIGITQDEKVEESAEEMRYHGEQKLLDFVQLNDPPIFEEFIKLNKTDIAIWSSSMESITPPNLYSTCKRRFTLRLIDQKKAHLICKSKLKYDKASWADISKLAISTRAAKEAFVEEGVNTLAKAAKVASNMVQQALTCDDSNCVCDNVQIDYGSYGCGDGGHDDDGDQQRFECSPHSEPTKEQLPHRSYNWAANRDSDNHNDEQRLHHIAYKKVAGETSEDVAQLSFGGIASKKRALLQASTSLLSQPCLNDYEMSTLELALSSIYNNINPKTVEILNELGHTPPTATQTQLQGLSIENVSLLEKIFAMKDADDIVAYICARKGQLAKEKKRETEEYLLLNILIY